MATSGTVPGDSPPGSAPATQNDDVTLYSGAALGLMEASSVTRNSLSRVIVVAGDEDCGKTTLIASLYEKFQEGPFRSNWFAGSLTLLGFEERCHLARIASGRETADTERTTPSAGIQFLHLSVRPSSPGNPREDILLADLPGEMYRLARDSTAEAERLVFLRRADEFLVALDGGKLAHAGTRAEAYANGVLLLRSCLDAKVLGVRARVGLLITKWDKVIASGPGAIQFAEGCEARFRDYFSDRVPALFTSRVAARPERGSALAFATGVGEMLERWLVGTAQLSIETRRPERDQPTRQFDLYGVDSHK